MSATSTPQGSQRDTASKPLDCLSPILLLLGWLAITLATFGQTLAVFIVSGTAYFLPAWVYALFPLGQVALLALPLIPLAIWWRNLRYRAVFQTWLLALVFDLFFTPVSLVKPTAAQTKFVVQIALGLGFSLFLVGLQTLRQRRSLNTVNEPLSRSPEETEGAVEGVVEGPLSVVEGSPYLLGRVSRPDHLWASTAPSLRLKSARSGLRFSHQRAGLFTATGIAGLCALPWLAYGALGSFTDTWLALCAALVFGLCTSLLLHFFLFQPLHALQGRKPNRNARLRDFLLGGFSAGTALLILASGTGFPYGVFAVLLMLVLAGLGWPLAGLSEAAERSRSGEPGRSGNWLIYAALAGLAAAAPYILIDADEFFLLVSATGGEILSWGMRAAVLGMPIGWLAGIIPLVAILLRKDVDPNQEAPDQDDHTPQSDRADRVDRARWKRSLALAIFTWAEAALLYLFVGQTGFHGESLFVILKDQLDTSAFSEIDDYTQRRSELYQALVAQANATQAGLRQTLDRVGVRYQPYYLVNALEVQGGPLLRLWLLTRPEVDRVLDNPWLRPLPEPAPTSYGSEDAPRGPEWNLTSIGADRVWRELGVTGEGIVVGQSDSGVDGSHPELADSYRGQSSPAEGNPALHSQHDYNWYDPWYGTESPTDVGGHGTHTLGSILGNHTGVAPDATWFACVNLARNLGNPALYLDCMQFMLAPFPQGGDPLQDGDPSRGAHVLNNSWGCPELEGCDPNTFLQAVRALRHAGVFVVASAGNDGPRCESLNAPPAIYAEALSVGAINAFDELAFFSSLGPVTVDGSGRVKPDMLAPGEEVLSAMPGGTYAAQSGTSMAGPHLVGVVALMWSANPALIGDIERTEQILIQTAQPYRGSLPACPGVSGTPSTAVGYGVVDAYAAVKMALEKR